MQSESNVPHELLCFQTTEVVARTRRGEYQIRFVRDDSEYNGRAYASFHGYDGEHEFLGPCMGDEREVAAACDQHAYAQPSHPSMLGWPACGDLEVAHG